MNLSICIITKNEEQNIDRCLKALAPYGLETIVVDTGSTDRTKQIAARYTDRLYDFPWCDDFSAAKNFAIEKASHSYVLVLDSDEFVEQLDLSALEKQIAAHPGAVGRIRRRNVFHRNGEEQENREWINRIFAKEYFHYEGRIHEQVTPLRGAESGYRTYETPVVILHTGYDLPEQQKKEKAERNIRLLEQEFSVTVVNRDGELRVEGEPEDTMLACKAIQALLTLSSRGEAIGEQNVRYVIGLVRSGKESQITELTGDVLCISAKGRPIKPKTIGQKEYIKSVLKNTVTIGVGPAGIPYTN